MKQLLVPTEAPKSVKYLLFQASRDGFLTSEEDAAAVWKELVCVAAVEDEECQKHNMVALSKG